MDGNLCHLFPGSVSDRVLNYRRVLPAVKIRAAHFFVPSLGVTAVIHVAFVQQNHRTQLQSLNHYYEELLSVRSRCFMFNISPAGGA